MEHQELRDMVRELLKDMISDKSGKSESCETNCSDSSLDNFVASDISALDSLDMIGVESPNNLDAIIEMRKTTPARIGVGRAGPRQNTKTMLKFRADHAGAMDAVFNDVSEDLIKEMNLLPLQSLATNKDEFLMGPELGRTLNDESAALVKEKCVMNPQVQIIVADGLSSTAVESNIKDILPAIEQGVKTLGFTLGTSVFVKYGRVGVMDHIAQLVGSKVTINLIGERPGLVTGESYSAYITYEGKVGMAESSRSVVSNIYRGGTPPAEAGAHIADLCKRIIETKKCGMDLK